MIGQHVSPVVVRALGANWPLPVPGIQVTLRSVPGRAQPTADGKNGQHDQREEQS